MRLYHAGYEQIPEPDVRRGRLNADFGQGFYTAADPDFAARWAREQKGRQVWINIYELDLTGLRVLRLERDLDWLDYLLANRRAQADLHPEADVIIGPIANDTIYNTFGIITSGLISREEALALLRLGPCREQTVLKTGWAAVQLRFLSARTLTPEELRSAADSLAREEAAYQTLMGETMVRFSETGTADSGAGRKTE